MGTDAGDYSGSGRRRGDRQLLERDAGSTTARATAFIDEASSTGWVAAHATFAAFFFDYDLDGRPRHLPVGGVADIQRSSPR
jgi:hypothetical protein